jgi:hypothetical protein
MEKKTILLRNIQTYDNQFYTFRINFGTSKSGTKNVPKLIVEIVVLSALPKGRCSWSGRLYCYRIQAS